MIWAIERNDIAVRISTDEKKKKPTLHPRSVVLQSD